MKNFPLFLIAAASLPGAVARAQSTERVSVDSSGVQANGDSQHLSISADGRYVAFDSAATNLIAGDTNGKRDIFVRDRLNGTTERVSLGHSGLESNGDSQWPAISADGRYVAYSSTASNIVSGDTNGFEDVFVRDRVAGVNMRVSVSNSGGQASSWSMYPRLSADGRYVAFESMANGLAGNDFNNNVDSFVRDLQAGTTECVSVDTSGSAAVGAVPDISGDGRFVVFTSYSQNIAGGGTGNVYEVFVRDRLNGTSERVSVDSSGVPANAHCQVPSISADGRWVSFASGSSNLVPNDTNGVMDIFVHDRSSGQTVRASVSSSGVQGDGDCDFNHLRSEGRLVAFESFSTTFGGDGQQQIFVHDRSSGETHPVSVNSQGTLGSAGSDYPAISADGRFVAFMSTATNLVSGDTNACADIFVRDLGAPAGSAFCSGDGSAASCPCANNGALDRGCQNSQGTGGAALVDTGLSTLAADSLRISSSGELSTASTIFLQGSASIAPFNFGDGLRCTGGSLKRLYLHGAVGGSVSAPQVGEPSVSARSAALGDVIAPGTTRYYQAYYRDPDTNFCPSPTGNTWNVSSAIAVSWEP